MGKNIKKIISFFSCVTIQIFILFKKFIIKIILKVNIFNNIFQYLKFVYNIKY